MRFEADGKIAWIVVTADMCAKAGAGIGETENFANRIAHHGKKDWWTQFVAFVSKDRNLTKAHVRFLEQKLFSAHIPKILKEKVDYFIDCP